MSQTDLPSPVEVIDAFVKDLGNLFQLSHEPAGSGSTRHIHFASGAGGVVNWILDDDYFFVGCFGVGAGSAAWSLNTDGNNPGTAPGNDNEAGKVRVDTVLASSNTCTNSTAFFFGPFRTPLKKNSKIYFYNGTGFLQSINVVLQRQH